MAALESQVGQIAVHRDSPKARIFQLSIFLLSALLAGCLSTGPVSSPVSDLEPTFSEPPSDIQKVIQDAAGMTEQGRLDSALVILKQAQSSRGYHPELHLASGEIFESIGEARSAREEYETVILREPGNVRALTAMGTLHISEGRLDLAEKFLRQAVEHDRARVRLTKPMLQVDSGSPVNAYNGLGIVYDKQGQHELAAEYFLQALQIEKSSQLYNNLGYSRYLAGNFGPAEWAYQQALGINQNYKPALRNLALLAGAQGNFSKAESLLSQAGAGNSAFLDLGRIAQANGDHARAAEYFTRAQKVSGQASSDVTSFLREENSRPDEQQLTVVESKIVNARVLRVRDQDSTAGEVIAWLPRGTEVQVLENKGNWSLMTATRSNNNPVKGWVYSSYLNEKAN